MKKVYCKNCKLKCAYLGDDVNYDHDCPFYKRKWWKFWIN